jgi:hypothetical protein
MHCQQDNGFSPVLLLVNFFSFLPHILQQKLSPPISSRSLFFFIFENILLFAAAAINPTLEDKG